MDRAEALLSIAEIALGLAGFGGIFMALGSRGAARDPADTYRLVLLLGTALSTLVISLFPVAFQAVEMPDRIVWCASSALTTILLASLVVFAERWRRRYPDEIRAGELPLAAAAVRAVALLTLASQIANAAGLFGARAFGVFFFGLVFLVAFGGYLFARMLFLWRS
jgi:hypothetical protein